MSYKKIIVRFPNWIGDAVMAAPVAEELKRHFPNAEITAMCAAPVFELFKRDPFIDAIFCFSKPENAFLRRDKTRDIIEALRDGKYDLGVLLANSFSSAWWFWQGRVARRIGYRGQMRAWLLTDPIKPLEEPIHQVDRYKRLLKPLGIAVGKSGPRLYLSEEEIEAARALLAQRGCSSKEPLIGINPGAAFGSAKCWPPERFRSLALELLKDPRMRVVFFGDAKTESLVKEICRGLPPRAISLAGETSLRELMSLIQECDLLVTNDSGPMHIAAALGVPVVALFGSTDDHATGPYGQKDGVIHKRASCSPCFRRVCPIDFRCMKAISVEEVIEKIQERRPSDV